jgi:hypothetical protein
LNRCANYLNLYFSRLNSCDKGLKVSFGCVN